MATQAPKNLAEVRDALGQVSAQVRDDRRFHIQAKEANNALGKMAGAAQIYLEACRMDNRKPSDSENWGDFLFEAPPNP